MFEQNNVGVRVANPVRTYLRYVVSLETSEAEIDELLDGVRLLVGAVNSGSTPVNPFLINWESFSTVTSCIGEDCDEDEDGDEESEEEIGGDALIQQTGGECAEEGDLEERSAEWLIWNERIEQLPQLLSGGGEITVDGVRKAEKLTELFRMLRDAGDEHIFPPLDGTAFYTNICKINHSCDPNVYVKYPDGVDVLGGGASPLRAQLLAARDIQSGEELVQSYVDQSLGERVMVVGDVHTHSR